LHKYFLVSCKDEAVLWEAWPT